MLQASMTEALWLGISASDVELVSVPVVVEPVVAPVVEPLAVPVNMA